jgi:hypothetical protein
MLSLSQNKFHVPSEAADRLITAWTASCLSSDSSSSSSSSSSSVAAADCTPALTVLLSSGCISLKTRLQLQRRCAVYLHVFDFDSNSISMQRICRVVKCFITACEMAGMTLEAAAL